VEELIQLITDDTQNLVNYHAVKSASLGLYAILEEIIVEIKSVELLP